MFSNFLVNARYDINIFIEGYEWLGELWFVISKVAPIVMITVATVVAIILIVLGIKASKQETPDKRERMVVLVKRILIGAIVFEVVLGAIFVVNIFVPQIVLKATAPFREAVIGLIM